MVQDRVLNEMLGSIQDTAGGGWKVLVLDSTTTRILSAAMRMSDILEAGALLSPEPVLTMLATDACLQLYSS